MCKRPRGDLNSVVGVRPSTFGLQMRWFTIFGLSVVYSLRPDTFDTYASLQKLNEHVFQVSESVAN
jgi:hypothetical protein